MTGVFFFGKRLKLLCSDKPQPLSSRVCVVLESTGKRRTSQNMNKETLSKQQETLSFRNKLLEAAFAQLSTEARELYLDCAVPRLPGPPRALDFMRDWVAPNKPVVFTGAFNHWAALQRWKDHNYLRYQSLSQLLLSKLFACSSSRKVLKILKF